MAQQLLYLGLNPDDGSGTKGRAGGDIINDNFTELYNVSLNSSGTVDGTDQLFTGHVAVGDNASVDAITLITADGTVNPAGGFESAAVYLECLTDVGNFGAQTVGLSTQLYVDQPFGTPTGFYSRIEGTGTSFASAAGNGFYSSFTTAVGAKAFTDIAHFVAGINAWSGDKPINVNGMAIANQGVSGITTATGIKVIGQSGATNNYGIVLSGDGAGADIVFGTDKDSSIHEESGYLELVADLQSVGSRWVQTTGDHKVTGDATFDGEISGSKVMFDAADNTGGLTAVTKYLRMNHTLAMSSLNGYPMPRSGSITGIACKTWVSAYTDGDIQAEIRVNGTVVFAKVFELAGTGHKTVYDSQDRGVTPFDAGDLIAMSISPVTTTNQTWNYPIMTAELILDN